MAQTSIAKLRTLLGPTVQASWSGTAASWNHLLLPPLTCVISVGPVATGLLEGSGRGVDTDIHAVLLGRGRSNLEESREGLGGEKGAQRQSLASLRCHPQLPLQQGSTHRKHGRPILESARQARDARIVGQTGVAVARRQGRVQERLLGGVMRLGLVLLRLRQGGGWRWGRSIASTKLREVP